MTNEDRGPTLTAFDKLSEHHGDAIVFMLVGDFFETFEGDAREAADVLRIPLRPVTLGGRKVVMCGFPRVSAEAYVARLIEAGKRVALAEPYDPNRSR